MAAFNFDEFYSRLRERFSGEVSAEDGLDQLLSDLEKTWHEADNLVLQEPTGDRSLIACRAGCQDCCVVNVSITLLEGISIARFLSRLNSSDLAGITSRLNKLWCAVRGLEDDERLLARKKCAFLDEQGCCIIYPVRPFFCRSISSTDVELCRTAVTGQIFGEAQSVIMHQFQLQLYKTAFAGVADGLELAGLDGRSFQLCGLVRYLLGHPGREGELLTEASLGWNDLYP